MTREDKNGLVRDAYDLYKLSDILNVFSVVKKYKTKIRRKVDVVQHNFMTFYENLKYASIAVIISALVTTTLSSRKLRDIFS